MYNVASSGSEYSSLHGFKIPLLSYGSQTALFFFECVKYNICFGKYYFIRIQSNPKKGQRGFMFLSFLFFFSSFLTIYFFFCIYTNSDLSTTVLVHNPQLSYQEVVDLKTYRYLYTASKSLILFANREIKHLHIVNIELKTIRFVKFCNFLLNLTQRDVKPRLCSIL